MRNLIILFTGLMCFSETYLLNQVFPWTMAVPLSALIAILIVVVVVLVLEDKEPLG